MRIFIYLLVLVCLVVISCDYEGELTQSRKVLFPVDTIVFSTINPYNTDSYYNKDLNQDYISYINVDKKNIVLLVNDDKGTRKYVFNYKKVLDKYGKDNFNILYYFTDTLSVNVLIKNTITEIYNKNAIVNINIDSSFFAIDMENPTGQPYYFSGPISAFGFQKSNTFIASCFPVSKVGEDTIR